MGSDILNQIGGQLNPFSTQDPYTTLQCTVAQVKIVDGQATIDEQVSCWDFGIGTSSVSGIPAPFPRAKQIKKYPWFAHKRPWQREIDLMLSNGFKLEVEALISKDISYVTEEYVPARLAEQDFLD